MSYLLCCSYSLAYKEPDVYEDLWNNNMDIADKTLHVDFLQQMQANSLQAERYVNFTLQDINYVWAVTSMLKIMSTRVRKPQDISEFLTGRYKSYNNFLFSLLNQYYLKVRAEIISFIFILYIWYLKLFIYLFLCFIPCPWLQAVPSIKPTPAMDKYLANYAEVMKKDPIYFAVALLPCSRLWVWLANTLNIPKTNVYYTWKEDNKDGNIEKHYKALLNKYLDTKKKINRANDLFRKQMQNEHDFFATSWADHIVN